MFFFAVSEIVFHTDFLEIKKKISPQNVAVRRVGVKDERLFVKEFQIYRCEKHKAWGMGNRYLSISHDLWRKDS
jgi:hypothetical protein